MTDYTPRQLKINLGYLLNLIVAAHKAPWSQKARADLRALFALRPVLAELREKAKTAAVSIGQAVHDWSTGVER